MQKIRNVPYIDFFRKLEKPHSSPILDPFVPKTSKQDFSKKIIRTIFWLHGKNQKNSTRQFLIKLSTQNSI